MSGSGSRALVVADGDVPPLALLDETWPGWRSSTGIVVGADGGARKAESIGLRPELVVGDADSIDSATLQQMRERGVRVRIVPEEKDASDTELAVAEGRAAGADAVTVLGALGGLRFDHALANVLLLSGADAGDVTLVDGSTRIRLLRAEEGSGRRGLAFEGAPGDLVSLLPIGDAGGVRTAGLHYPLHDEPLPAGTTRGLSNVRTAARAEVSLDRGMLLVVETATAPRGAEGRS